MNKYSDQQLKHQEIFKRLEENVPEEVMAKIEENRQIHLDKFGEVMSELQSKEEFKESLKNIMESGQSAIRQVQMMEIIEELGDQAILEVRERVQEMKQEHQELFQNLDAERLQIQQRTETRVQEQSMNSGDDTMTQQQNMQGVSTQNAGQNGKVE